MIATRWKSVDGNVSRRQHFTASAWDDKVRSPKTVIAKRPAPSLACLAAACLCLLAGCASRPKPQPPTAVMLAERAPAKSLAPPRRLGLNTSIETICASPAGKAVLDRDLPGLTGRPEFAMFKAMTLKQLQPMSSGHITDAMLAKVGADLAALNAKGGGK